MLAQGLCAGLHGRDAGAAVRLRKDAAYCRSLADAISTFDATLIFLCIGAPKSELFAYRYRALLPPAWALCVGQSFRLLLGMNAPPTRPDGAPQSGMAVAHRPRTATHATALWAQYDRFLRAAVADMRQSR